MEAIGVGSGPARAFALCQEHALDVALPVDTPFIAIHTLDTAHIVAINIITFLKIGALLAIISGFKI